MMSFLYCPPQVYLPFGAIWPAGDSQVSNSKIFTLEQQSLTFAPPYLGLSSERPPYTPFPLFN